MYDVRHEAYEYFKENPGFSRCFIEMRKKWEALGRTGGTVRLTDCTEDERRAMEGLLGKSFYGMEIVFSIKDFETALKSTRFRTLGMRELMELYFNEPIRTNAERKMEKETQQNAFFQKMRHKFCQLALEKAEYLIAADWMKAVSEEKAYGYSLLIREWIQNPELAESTVTAVGTTLAEVQETEGETTVLALLAARVSGNPHYFDRGTAAGLLLTHCLCWHSESQMPTDANSLAELYLQYGIQMDDVSSTIVAFGLHLEKNGVLHPAYEGFLKMQEPAVIMQKNMNGVTRVYGESSKIYIVENEMVFSHLCHCCRHLPVTILCTSGQPRKVAWQVLDLLAAEDILIYYSGDLDPEGMDIAERIWKRYPEKVCLWRMDEAAYSNSLSEETIVERRLSLLDRLEHPHLRDIAEKMRQVKKAGYQESILETLVDDIINNGF